MGIERDAGLGTRCSRRLNGAVKVPGSFGVDGQLVCACVAKLLKVAVRLFNHQVNVEKGRGHGASNVRNDGGTEGDVRNKAAVHDVAVNPVGTKVYKVLDLFTKASKVGGQDRRGNNGQEHLQRCARSTASRHRYPMVSAKNVEGPSEQDFRAQRPALVQIIQATQLQYSEPCEATTVQKCVAPPSHR